MLNLKSIGDFKYTNINCVMCMLHRVVKKATQNFRYAQSGTTVYQPIQLIIIYGQNQSVLNYEKNS